MYRPAAPRARGRRGRAKSARLGVARPLGPSARKKMKIYLGQVVQLRGDLHVRRSACAAAGASEAPRKVALRLVAFLLSPPAHLPPPQAPPAPSMPPGPRLDTQNRASDGRLRCWTRSLAPRTRLIAARRGPDHRLACGEACVPGVVVDTCGLQDR